MTRLRTTAACAAAILAFAATPAAALSVRTFVSSKGSDANACSIAAPCRTFAGALANTAAGGEIVVLDSAGFGGMTITQPVTISNQSGVEGGITVTSGTAITINLRTIPGTVTLKGLTIDGGGTGDTGILSSSTANGALNIIDCTVRGFSNGISVAYGPAVASHLKVMVLDTLVTNNSGTGLGVGVTSGVGTVDFLARHSTVVQNGDGVVIGVNANGSIISQLTEIEASSNAGYGIRQTGTNGSNYLYLRNSTAQNNGNSDLQTELHWVAYLLNHNIIYRNTNSGTAYGDGTNFILAPVGTAVTSLTALY